MKISQIKSKVRQISYGIHRTRFGALGIAVTEHGICSCEFLEEDEDIGPWLERLEEIWPEADRIASEEAGLASLQAWLKDGTTVLPLVVRKATPLQISVWKKLCALPRGETISYQALAEQVGKPTAARAVGTCVGKNQHALFIPCHRAVRQDGSLGGFRWGLDRKRRILLWEKTGC